MKGTRIALTAGSLLALMLFLAGCAHWRPPSPAAAPETADTAEATEAVEAQTDQADEAANAQTDQATEAVKVQADQATDAEPQPPVEAKGVPQTMCAVMDWPIDKRYFVDYQGKRIYFSCSIAAKRFMEEPERYMVKLREKGVLLEDSPQE